jgi:hypothetical protein
MNTASACPYGFSGCDVYTTAPSPPSQPGGPNVYGNYDVYNSSGQQMGTYEPSKSQSYGSRRTTR